MAPTIRSDLGPGIPPSISLGAIPRNGGVEFVLFSRHATAVELLLFEQLAGEPTHVVMLEPRRNRRGDLWYVFVPGIGPGQLYAYRVCGPDLPEEGHCFDPTTVLLDPCAKAIASVDSAAQPDADRPPNRTVSRCVVVSDTFDWQDVPLPRCALADSIIYEAHVRGLTAHPSSMVKHPGTYRGLLEKIPYLKDLGITAVELLPVQEYDHLEFVRRNPLTGEWLTNYWGYSPIDFMAPNSRYAAGGRMGAQVEEFKTLVRELHRAGLEVILDVVFNHSAEGNHLGPIINFKGIDNSIYYLLQPENRRFYKDFSGCGNSINGNHPVVRQHIRACLTHWVSQMQVDGFRFDLASVLSRDRDGHLIANPPVLESIAEDPMLRDTKIIAEAWDAAGAYQVGSFPGGRWAEWNGRFRDDIRQFWRGDHGKTGALATRLTGSSDLYQASGRKPYHSINFVTCHDGFTLNDLVSYNYKHNLSNGEDNRDGDNNSYSHNHGVEGPTNKARIDRLRVRQIKNFLATLMLSQGVPMLLGGDEFRRTQLGNNNAYCQDNAIAWFDWSLLETNSEIFRFCKGLIWFRRRHPVLRRTEFFSGKRLPGRAIADVNWFTPAAQPKDWHTDDQTLMCLIDGSAAGLGNPPDVDLLLLFNASLKTVQFVLPHGGSADQPWSVFLDTGNAPPFDLNPDENGPSVLPGNRYPLIDRSMACLFRPHRTGGR